jgi:hypothetical protein
LPARRWPARSDLLLLLLLLLLLGRWRLLQLCEVLLPPRFLFFPRKKQQK